MKWEDEGIMLAARPYGERNIIIEVFTESHGRHLGMVRNVNKNKSASHFEPGAQLKLVWASRLQEQLGVFSTEILKSRTLNLIHKKEILLGFNSIISILLTVLPEREPCQSIYYTSINLIDSIAITRGWLADYVEWELFILSELGYGLDLSTCALTGSNSNLAYVSPKTGRAVSKAAGKDWKNRLLPLPDFLINRDMRKELTLQSLEDGFRLTGYFLTKWLLNSLNGKPLPGARDRFLKAILN